MAKQVADSAIQVLGGYGYVGEYRVERLWRDAKLMEIGGGTVEAHQKNIARDLARIGTIGSLSAAARAARCSAITRLPGRTSTDRPMKAPRYWPPGPSTTSPRG